MCGGVGVWTKASYGDNGVEGGVCGGERLYNGKCLFRLCTLLKHIIAVVMSDVKPYRLYDRSCVWVRVHACVCVFCVYVCMNVCMYMVYICTL